MDQPNGIDEKRSDRVLPVLLLTILLGGVACDAFDPSALLPKTAGSAETATASADGTKREPDTDPRRELDRATSFGEDGLGSVQPRDPNMQSIGPDDSQRIYYQFVDDRGRVQFVERLGDVPAAWRDRVGYVEMNQPPPLTPLEARASWKLSESRTQEILLATATGSSGFRAAGSDSVVLYSAAWCGYCTKAKKHLDRADVDYEIRDVDNPAIAQELQQKTGRGGVPVLDFSGEILRGYSSEQYDRMIRSIQG